MNITFITLFPQEMATFFSKGILGRAQEKGAFKVSFVQLRDFAEAPHHKVDDYPFGCRKGMLLRVDVLDRAIQSIPNYQEARIIYTCPKGNIFNQAAASSFANASDLIFICGYYEGIDDRLFDLYSIERWSIGDMILTSGELPAMTMVDTTVRMLNNVLGNSDSVFDDSIISGLLEHPQYTVPRDYKKNEVPGVILSGHHGRIAEWQREYALKQSLFLKPHLLSKASISTQDLDIISRIIEEKPLCQ